MRSHLHDAEEIHASETTGKSNNTLLSITNTHFFTFIVFQSYAKWLDVRLNTGGEADERRDRQYHNQPRRLGQREVDQRTSKP